MRTRTRTFSPVREGDRSGRIVLVSFAQGKFRPAGRRLKRQAKRSEFFDHVMIYQPRMLGGEFRAQQKDMLVRGSKGFGYWIWKPHIIQRELEQLEEGNVLVYLDAGCRINPHGSERFWEYVEIAIRSQSGVLCSELSQVESEWTKADVFASLNVMDRVEITHSPQRQGGVLFLRNSPPAKELVSQWAQLAQENRSLFDDSPSREENFPGFVEHRHDQSVFSVLSKILGAETFSALEVRSSSGKRRSRAAGVYAIEARRDPGGFLRPQRSWLKRMLLGSMSDSSPGCRISHSTSTGKRGVE